MFHCGRLGLLTGNKIYSDWQHNGLSIYILGGIYLDKLVLAGKGALK